MKKNQIEKTAGTLPGPSVVHALTAGAMALPGLAGTAAAEGPVEEFTVDAADYSFYKEDALRPSKVFFGQERDRMEIHSYKFRVSAPLTSRTDLDVAGGYETMSGASPWFTLLDTNGEATQVMSEATIDDQRGDLALAGNYYFDSGKATASAGTSVEKDYWSINFGFGGDWSFNDKNTTISSGVGISLDWINPTDAQDFDRKEHGTKRAITAYGGFSQVLTRHSAFQSTLTFGYTEGFLSDPYKKVSIGTGGNERRDSRPNDRMQFTWLNRYRHHVSAVNGTLHLDYRLYADDWSMDSHTFDIAWYQSLPFGFQLIPSFRYYSQSQADFYEVFYTAFENDGLYSTDYRLSPYGAISYRIKLTYTAEDVIGPLDVEAALSYERYESKSSWALQDVDVTNPGLVAFRLYAARLTVRF